MHDEPAQHSDVVVVGARAAGAATAMLLARAGLTVTLVDRSAYGTDTVSTHGLMRAGVLQLDRWGVLPQLVAAGTPPVRQTVFHYGGQRSVRVSIRPGAACCGAVCTPATSARPGAGRRSSGRRSRRCCTGTT